MAGNCIVTIMLLMLLLLFVVEADHFTSLSVNDPPITTHQAPAASPNPIDTLVSFPLPTPIDIPITPRLPVSGIGLPKNYNCASKCSRSCSLQKTNRFAHMKCLDFCQLNCVRGISDCTNDCVESKSPNFDLRAKKLAKCSKNDISVVQGPTKPQPNGIPTYAVQITNTCATGCAIANIHLSCGSFSSAIPINPNIFRRIAINDCLVNNGQPLAAGHALSFDYATTFQFPLSVSTITC